MKRKFGYDPVREMYDALSSNDITLEYAFMLFGTEREAMRVIKHGFSDGYLEAYEIIVSTRRYMDVWELDEITRGMRTSEAARRKAKDVFLSATKKGLERER